jgi:hypothetical protein
MSNSFQNGRLAVTMTPTTIYTVPPNTTTVVLSIMISNIHASASAVLAIDWHDNSANADTSIANAVICPVGFTYEAIANKLVLKAGDYIQISADAANKLEATISVMDIS